MACYYQSKESPQGPNTKTGRQVMSSVSNFRQIQSSETKNTRQGVYLCGEANAKEAVAKAKPAQLARQVGVKAPESRG